MPVSHLLCFRRDPAYLDGSKGEVKLDLNTEEPKSDSSAIVDDPMTEEHQQGQKGAPV